MDHISLGEPACALRTYRDRRGPWRDRPRGAWGVILAALLLSAACSDDENLASDGTQSGSNGTGSGDTSALAPTLSSMGTVLCGDVLCQCNNGVDDDNDGVSDGFDTECSGPGDNDEGSFGTGIPGDNRDGACQDCFFDGNSGSGNDGCRYPTSCLTEGNASSGQGSCNSCAPSQQCVNYCQQYTPNGCDCYGCCEVHKADGSIVNIVMSSSCTLENIDNPAACQQCVPSTACRNDCGECELCAGKTPAQLPSSCSGSSTTSGGTPVNYTCEGGQTACNTDGTCPSGFFCTYGCCLPFAPLI